MSNKALFADLDGTLIKTKSGKTFPKDKNDWYIPNDVVKALKKYNPKYLLIVTNQGGIEKGLVDRDEFYNEKLPTIIKDLQTLLPDTRVEVQVCTSNNVENVRRKPNTGMVDFFLTCYNLNKKNCLMIGDASGLEGQFSDSDKKTAENADIEYLDINKFIEKYAEDNV